MVAAWSLYQHCYNLSKNVVEMKIIQENFLQLTPEYFPLVGVCNFGSLASCCLGALLDSLQCIFFMSGAGPELNLSYQVCLVV